MIVDVSVGGFVFNTTLDFFFHDNPEYEPQKDFATRTLKKNGIYHMKSLTDSLTKATITKVSDK